MAKISDKVIFHKYQTNQKMSAKIKGAALYSSLSNMVATSYATRLRGAVSVTYIPDFEDFEQKET